MRLTFPLMILLFSALSACSTIQKTAEAPASSPSLAQVQKTRLTGVDVRWGGEVVKVRNFSDHTLVEVISRSLRKSGEPRISDQSEGRFFARVDQFIDPENLKPGRLFTVKGSIESWQRNKIGEYAYLYPVVAVAEQKIWPKPRLSRRHYYDPYWDDWGPPYVFGAQWGHFGYFGHRYHRVN